MQKRVLIGSFVLIIVGLFFIIGTDVSITGAAIGISTSALDSASNPLFGFFLVWIACFMLIATAEGNPLERILRSEKKVEGYVKIDHGYLTDVDIHEGIKKRKYLNKDGTPKKPWELNKKESEDISKFVESENVGRWTNEFLGEKFFKLYQTWDKDKRDLIKGMYHSYAGLTDNEEMEIEKNSKGLSDYKRKIREEEIKRLPSRAHLSTLENLTIGEREKVVKSISKALPEGNYDADLLSKPENLKGFEDMYQRYKAEMNLYETRKKQQDKQKKNAAHN